MAASERSGARSQLIHRLLDFDTRWSESLIHSAAVFFLLVICHALFFWWVARPESSKGVGFVAASFQLANSSASWKLAATSSALRKASGRATLSVFFF